MTCYHMGEPKSWAPEVFELLERSIAPLPIEPNELDRKSGFSPDNDRLVEPIPPSRIARTRMIGIEIKRRTVGRAIQ